MFDIDQIQVRATAEIADVDVAEGTADVKVMTYEHEVQLAEDLFEVFTTAAFAASVGNPSRVKISDQQHNRAVIIGDAATLEDRADALYGRLRIVDTSAGRDVLMLMRERVLTELSVEFRPQKRYMRVIRRPDGGVLVRHDRAVLMGISPVGAGAYGDASRVLMVREASREFARERALAELSALTSGPRRV